MAFLRNAVAAALLAPFALGASPIPGNDLVEAPATAKIRVHNLDQEIVVENWILCTSRPVTEQLLSAFGEGPVRAAEIYGALKAAKSCGRLPQLRVILKEPILQPGADRTASAFNALIGVSGGWASGFVVDGKMPSPQR